MNSNDLRLEREREFHKNRYDGAGDPRAALNRWYWAVDDVFRAHEAMLKALAPGRDVLELGVADGSFSVLESGVAALPRRFVGIDVSDGAVAHARARAAALGMARARFEVRDAESTGLEDAGFDLVFGRGILHHLRLDSAYREVARLLRPGGTGLFVEPMGHNPALNWYRHRTPDLRTSDEHPLLMADLALARRHFAQVHVRHSGLTTLAAVPLRHSVLGEPLMKTLRGLDRLLFTVPLLRRQAWFVLVTLRR